MILANRYVCTALGATTGLIETAAATRCSGAGCAACLSCITAGALLVVMMLAKGSNKHKTDKESHNGMVKGSY